MYVKNKKSSKKTYKFLQINFAVNQFISFDKDYRDNDVIQYMGALEKNSRHPLSTGILEKIKELKLNIPMAEDVKNLPGVGLEGKVNDAPSLVRANIGVAINAILLKID